MTLGAVAVQHWRQHSTWETCSRKPPIPPHTTMFLRITYELKMGQTRPLKVCGNFSYAVPPTHYTFTRTTRLRLPLVAIGLITVTFCCSYWTLIGLCGRCRMPWTFELFAVRSAPVAGVRTHRTVTGGYTTRPGPVTPLDHIVLITVRGKPIRGMLVPVFDWWTTTRRWWCLCADSAPGGSSAFR